MFYVYYLRSIPHSDKTYVGLTHNLKQRFSDHNAGKSIYTAQYKPWKMIGFLGFDTELKSLKFERYLKSNAGRIFYEDIFLIAISKIHNSGLPDIFFKNDGAKLLLESDFSSFSFLQEMPTRLALSMKKSQYNFIYIKLKHIML